MQQQQPRAAAQPQQPETSVASNLLFDSAGEFVKRTLMVFVFWFALGGILAMAYNVVVTRVYTCRLAAEDDPIPEDELSLRQLDDHQMLSFALALGAAAVTGRIVLEFVASNFGRDTAAIVSGQAIVLKPELERTAEVILDEEQQQQRPAVVMPQTQPPPPPQQPQQPAPAAAVVVPPPPAAFARGPY